MSEARPASALSRWRALRSGLWNLVAAAGLSCAGMGGAVLAEPLEDAEHKRAHDPMSVVLWSPPPAVAAGSDVIYDEAQWGSPDAPFVFLGDTLRVGGSFESGRRILIGEQARIDVLDGTVLHLSGSIGNDGGSHQGLLKLGAGMLQLSGTNDYQGNTLLLQGGLRVSGSQALGAPTRTLNVNTGTMLEYAPGATVANAVQLQAENIAAHVPAGEWTPIPPGEYSDRVRWVVAEGEAVQAGLLAGMAPFVKQGAGRLRIDGDALAYWGSAQVQEGALAVNAVFSGALAVAPAARLEGSGSVGSVTIQPGGILAPGAAGGGIGQLSVRGDLVLQPGARFEVDAGPSGTADRLQVGGKAALDGHLAVLAQAGDWRAQTQYVVLRAEGGLEGSRFASAGSNFAFLDPSLDYDERQVYLTLRRNDVPFEDAAGDPDEEELAGAVEEEGGHAGSENGAGQGGKDPGGDPGPGIYDRVVTLDRDQAREAFRQLSGSWGGSLWSAMVEDSRHVRQAVLDAAHPSSVPYSSGLYSGSHAGSYASSYAGSYSGSRSGVSAGGPAAAAGPLRFWARAFHSAAERRDAGAAAGDWRDTQGLVLGATHDFAEHTAAGLYLGFQRSRLRRMDGLADASIDGTHAGLSLAGRGAGGLYALGAGYSWHRLRSSRRIAVADWREGLRDSYRAGLFQVFGEWSRPLSLAALGGSGAASGGPGAAVLEPYGRLAWVRADTRGHAESGAQAALDVSPSATASWFGSLGLRLMGTVSGPAGPVRLRAAAAWRRAGGDLRATTEQSFLHSARQVRFRSQGQPIRRDAWSLDLGLRAGLGRAAELALAYEGQFGSGSSDHGVTLNLSRQF